MKLSLLFVNLIAGAAIVLLAPLALRDSYDYLISSLHELEAAEAVDTQAMIEHARANDEEGVFGRMTKEMPSLANWMTSYDSICWMLVAPGVALAFVNFFAILKLYLNDLRLSRERA